MNNLLIPTTLAQMWSMHADYPSSLVYSGGTDLLVGMDEVTRSKEKLICLERIAELYQIEHSESCTRMGAGAKLNRLLHEEEIRFRFPILVQAIASLASPAIRNMATMGGNICTASPAGDTLPSLYVLEAELELMSCSTIRKIPIQDFIYGPGKVALNSGEIVSAIILKYDPNWSIQHYEKVGRRNAMACSVASLAALIRLEEDYIQSIRLAWGSLGPSIVRSHAIEEQLIGLKLSRENLISIFPMVQKAIAPIADIRASEQYRRLLGNRLLFRLLNFVE
jgi:xanthine dehydrogenase FAD-binding subunit